MKLLREVDKQVQPAEDEVQAGPGPATPEGGWNVGHLANHGILLSCDGFSMKLDLDQLNALFDLAEDGESGEVKDHAGDVVFVEVTDKGIVLSREGDKTFPNGVMVDLKTLKEIGIEEHEGQPDAEVAAEGDEEQPEEEDDEAGEDDTIDPDDEQVDDEELKEGIKRAFRRSGKKIKRGFRVTSGFRKGRVVANVKNAFKPRAPARTRMKLKVAARKKKIIRVMKAKRTRMKPLSKRLVRMNKR